MPLINRPPTTWTDLLFGPRKEEQQSITEAIAAKQLGLLGSPPVDTRRVYPQQYTYQSPSDRQMFELLFPQGPEAAMGLAMPLQQVRNMPIYYHYTKGNFPINEFQVNSSRGAGFFGAEPEKVAYGAWGGRGSASSGNLNYLTGDNIVPVHIKGKIFGRDVHLPFETPEVIKNQSEWDSLVKKVNEWEPKNPEKYGSTLKDLKREAKTLMNKVLNSYVEDPTTGHYVKSKQYKWQSGESPDWWTGFEEKTADGSYVVDLTKPVTSGGLARINTTQAALKELGYDGAIISDEAGRTIAVFDPKKNVTEYFRDVSSK